MLKDKAVYIEIARLLRETDLSNRKIAERVGVYSRVVDRVANGRHVGVCDRCHHRVILPCLACWILTHPVKRMKRLDLDPSLEEFNGGRFRNGHNDDDNRIGSLPEMPGCLDALPRHHGYRVDDETVDS